MWPLVAYNLLQLQHWDYRNRITWSAFCHHNSVPFGLMVLYPFKKGVLKDQEAVADLLNSWCDTKKVLLDNMINLYTYDRYLSSNAFRSNIKDL